MCLLIYKLTLHLRFKLIKTIITLVTDEIRWYTLGLGQCYQQNACCYLIFLQSWFYFSGTRERMAESEILLELLLGDGDESELDGLTDDESGPTPTTRTSGNSLDHSSAQWFLDICEEALNEDDGIVEGGDISETVVIESAVNNIELNEPSAVLEREKEIQVGLPLEQTDFYEQYNQPSCSKEGERHHSTSVNNSVNNSVNRRATSASSRVQKKRKASKTPKNNSRPPSKIRKREPLVWEKKKFSCNIPSVNVPQNDLAQPVLTPLEYFKSYFSDDFFTNTAQCTNMYSISKFGKNLNTDCNEIKKLFGMHLMMGCLKYPRLRMYWQFGIELKPICQSMPRDRFFTLRNCLHVVDINDRPTNQNRLWKVQPVLDSVKNGCNSIERIAGNYSIDEQMIPFSGRTTLKQYVPNKPRPIGLKNFIITTSDGVLLDFEVYQGESTNLPMKQKVGLGPAVVLRLKDSVPPLSVLYFDRYFTSLQLMEQLVSEQYFGTGTLMLNRLQEITFSPNKDLKRGNFEELCSKDGKLVAIKWMDNQSVVMLSSVCGSEPVTLVKRWSKKDGMFVNVDCPAAIVTYNKNMGGVDLFNQQMEAYRTWFKTKKWTLKVILHFLDLAVVNSWFQYKNECLRQKKKKKEIMDLLEFRLNLSETLMSRPPTVRPHYESSDEVEEVRKPQNWRNPLPARDKRTDGFDHFPNVDDLKTARKCRMENCPSRSRVRCEKCNIYLCLTKEKNCFKLFHKK